MRKVSIVPGEYYHIYNRSVRKQPIFIDERDWVRFLFLVLHLQSPIVFQNIGRNISYYVKHDDLIAPSADEVIKTRYVELVAFVIMPNHFHLIVREFEGSGIARYLQRVQEAYSKYFNTKYDHEGHLFQGAYQAIHIKNNRQLLYLSTYLHRNPRELKGWRNKEHSYPWSSYQDYLMNRWGKLLRPEIITKQFSSRAEYKKFVQASPAKEILDDDHLV